MGEAEVDSEQPTVGHALDGLAHPRHRLRKLTSSGWYRALYDCLWDLFVMLRIPTPAGSSFASAIPRSMSSVSCFEPSFIFDSCDYDAIPEDVEADLIGETPTASEGEEEPSSRGEHCDLAFFSWKPKTFIVVQSHSGIAKRMPVSVSSSHVEGQLRRIHLFGIDSDGTSPAEAAARSSENWAK
ncbi:hypothetical protein FOZ63_009049, partial [Perkinsus olseni]